MYEPKKYDHLIGTPGFSNTLLANHFTLYEGYVKNVNTLLEKLKSIEPSPEASELKRRFGWEWNGMRLHEYYFGNMTREAQQATSDSQLTTKLKEQFGSVDAWEKDFRNTGAMRGIGWTMLVHDRSAKKLMNVWVTEHDMGHLAGTEPILVLDVFEHAYITDYGIKRADYIESFMKAINWQETEQRFRNS
ncbi:MAG: Fe-Mn family superoxide dismutase [Patescibacteria group bacterium]